VALALLLTGCGASTPTKPASQPTPAKPAAEATNQVASGVDPRIAAEFDTGLKALMGGDRKGAEDVFFAMTRAYPDMPGPYANLGMLLSLRGDYDNAIIALKRAVELGPTLIEAYNQLGLAYRHKGRFHEALEIYRRGLEVDPKNKNLLRNTGILLDIYLDMPKEAYNHYQRFLELVPDDKQVKIWSASVAARAGM